MIQEKLKGVLFDFEGYELRKVMHEIFFSVDISECATKAWCYILIFFFKWTLNDSLRNTILEISFK